MLRAPTAGSGFLVASYAQSNELVVVFSPRLISAAPSSAAAGLLPIRKTS
jgi:hypothetical protein